MSPSHPMALLVRVPIRMPRGRRLCHSPPPLAPCCAALRFRRLALGCGTSYQATTFSQLAGKEGGRRRLVLTANYSAECILDIHQGRERLPVHPPISKRP